VARTCNKRSQSRNKKSYTNTLGIGLEIVNRPGKEKKDQQHKKRLPLCLRIEIF
jgi:hypothetical protein